MFVRAHSGPPTWQAFPAGSRPGTSTREAEGLLTSQLWAVRPFSLVFVHTQMFGYRCTAQVLRSRLQNTCFFVMPLRATGGNNASNECAEGKRKNRIIYWFRVLKCIRKSCNSSNWIVLSENKKLHSELLDMHFAPGLHQRRPIFNFNLFDQSVAKHLSRVFQL